MAARKTKEVPPPAAAAPPSTEAEQLRMTLEASQLLSLDWDLETGSIRWAGEMPGIALPQVILNPAEAALPLVWPADRENLRRMALQCLETLKPTRAEFRVVTPDGLRWVAAVGRASRNAEGRPTRILGVLREVTQRKTRESALRRGARILDSVHDAVISASSDGTITTWNLAAERLYGYTAAEAVGQPLAMLYAADDKMRLEAEELGPTRASGTREVVSRQRRRDGSEITVAIRLTLLRDEDEESAGFVASVNDITESLRIREDLRQQREDLQVILDSVPAMIWYKDTHNRILRANRRAAEAMDMSPAVVEGASTYEVYPQEAEDYHRDDREVIESGLPKLGIVEPLTLPSGETRWVRTDKVPYRSAAGEIVGVIVFSVDITERVRAEEELKRAHDDLEQRVELRTRDLQSAVEALHREIAERQRAEERLRQHQADLAHLLRLHTVEGMAAQLAHEINQPLSAIINFSSGLMRRLARGDAEPEVLDKVSQDIRREAVRAAGVVRRLRDFVRKGPPRRAACDLAELIRDAVALIRSDTRREGLAYRLDVPPTSVSVRVDRIQIEQVVLNLLHNAVHAVDQAAAAKHEIAVAVTVEGDRVAVRVTDTGVGLPDGDPRQLFEPFFTTRPKGLGMGLSISRSIIENHGGELTAEPRERGASFVFTLPTNP